MARDWAATFDSWAKPVSDTENEKCERAERMIRAAIGESQALKAHTIRVFTQGSYRNDTNVRQDSDVDIAVCCTDICMPDFSMAPELTRAEVGISDAQYSHQQFKNEVGAALVAYFGSGGVTRGNKAFDVHENTSRVDADVVPCIDLFLYERGSYGITYRKGTNIRTDSGQSINNYPEQHAEEGKKKNVATGNTFKRVVRILKRLRNEMKDGGVAAAAAVPSFLIESLVWSCPNASFAHDTYYKDVRAVLTDIHASLLTPGVAAAWTEVNNIKFLFHPSQGWTADQATAFVVAAWQYVGFPA